MYSIRCTTIVVQSEGVKVDVIWAGAYELSQMYRRREVSPVEVVDALLDRLEAVNPEINAFVTVTAENARREAKAAERRFQSETDLPPLLGVPITVKDLTDTSGVRTTYGSTAYADHIPDEDAIAWERLKAAGTVLLGKTTSPEFGLLGVTESKLTGVTSTPWDTARAAGGSSGGAAASTAAGIAPLAWGSDGGGSIRVPSSLCGTVGVKPTIGRIPHNHNTDGDSTEGPITRNVVDAAMLLDATVGPDPRDRIALPATGEKYLHAALAEGDLRGVRIAYSPDLGGQVALHPEVERVFEAALTDLRAAGAIVEGVEIALPSASEFFDHYWGAEYIAIADEMHAQGLDVWPLIDYIADRARALTPQQVSAACRQGKTQIYEAYAGILSKFEFMVTPTTCLPAFPHAGDMGGDVVVDGLAVRNPAMAIHMMTESPSHAGLPAISVPCGFTSNNLPVGMQMIGSLYQDADLLAVGAKYQRVTDWHTRHPTL